MTITLEETSVVTFSDLVQIAVVVAAVGAAIVALVISVQDRKAAARAASRARQHQALVTELDLAFRLLQNANRGGSTDPIERAQLGAEQQALVGTLGKERVPHLWERRIHVDDQDLRRRLDDPSVEEFMKWKFESQLAVSAIISELKEFDLQS